MDMGGKGKEKSGGTACCSKEWEKGSYQSEEEMNAENSGGMVVRYHGKE